MQAARLSRKGKKEKKKRKKLYLTHPEYSDMGVPKCRFICLPIKNRTTRILVSESLRL